ncbi:hypothetical protein ACHAPT_007120 [Fusarium lateritium]
MRQQDTKRHPRPVRWCRGGAPYEPARESWERLRRNGDECMNLTLTGCGRDAPNRGRIVKDRATGQPKMSCRNWESGVVVRVSSRNSSASSSSSSSSSSIGTTTTSSNSTTSNMARASANAGSTSSAVVDLSGGSTEVKAAEAQARVQAGNASGEPDKGGDTSHTQHQQVTDMGIFDGTVPVPVRVPGRRYRAGEEPWFYSGQG